MFKKTIIASAVSAVFFAPMAVAITDDPENHSEARMALEDKGLPTGGATGTGESAVFGGLRQAEGTPFEPVFTTVNAVDEAIATTVSELTLPPNSGDTPNVEGALTALSEGNAEGAVAILTGGGVATSSQAGTVPVTVSGNVQANLTCNINATDKDFDFGDIDLNDASATSGAVTFTVTCANESVATNIYLSTNDQDPAAGNGSNELAAQFSDGTSTSDVTLAVQIDNDNDGAGDADIGGTAADANSAGDQSATTINLVANLTTADITSGSGGTLTHKGNPEIAVWVN